MRVPNSFRLMLVGLLVAEGLVAILLVPGRITGVAAGENAARQPVLVELFTSEGCSSCPPADALLAQLDATQPIAGAQAIVLSEHVTYWDHQGWRDPFSLESMTGRQKQYGDRFRLSDVYTPQVVVDGSAQLLGSDGPGLARAVATAAASPKEDLNILNAQWSGNEVHFTVRSAAAVNPKQVLVAVLAEDSAQSSVAHGENAGRSLRHVAVVRVMQEMSKGSEDGRALTLKVPVANQPQTTPMRLVVFLADRHNGRVQAVAERTISR